MSDYFFPFYFNDYYGGTIGFSYEMHGAYLAALTEQYQHGNFSEGWAKSVFGQDLWTKISHKFDKDDQGLFFNRRMVEISKRRESISMKRKLAINSRWSKKTDTNEIQLKYNCNTNLITSYDSSINALEGKEVLGEEETKKQEPDQPDEPEPPSWRTDYQMYLKEAEAEFDRLYADLEWIKEMRRFHPGVYVRRTVERMWTQYWGTEDGWKQKKSKKAKRINWKSTIQNTFSISAVRIPRGDHDDEEQWLEAESRRVAAAGS